MNKIDNFKIKNQFATDLICRVSWIVGLSPFKILGSEQYREICNYRQIISAFLYSAETFSLHEVGCFAGKRGHATVINSIYKYFEILDAKFTDKLKQDLVNISDQLVSKYNYKIYKWENKSERVFQDYSPKIQALAEKYKKKYDN